MTKLEWTEELSMGVEEIDGQHKELIRLANGLINAVALDREPRVLENVIRKLREYTVFHFHSEEALMEKTRYPRRGEHAKAHESIKNNVKRYQRRLYQQERIDPGLIANFLKIWLLKHILETDLEFARFLHKREKKAV